MSKRQRRESSSKCNLKKIKEDAVDERKYMNKLNNICKYYSKGQTNTLA